MILSALPDVMSLQAAVLSCPLFYSAFLRAKTSVTTHVLLNRVDASVFPDAIAASESAEVRLQDKRARSQSRSAIWDLSSQSREAVMEPFRSRIRKAIEDFVARNLRQRPTLPKSLSLKEALRLERFHSCVEQLAEQFAETTLAKCPGARPQPGTTYQERCRIQRALYRFEIFRNLFGGPDRLLPIVPSEKKPLFFDNFPPWEIEQLGCIHDFLFRAIKPAFNDVAEHCIEWVAAGVEYAEDLEDALYAQYILTLGLEELWRIARAEGYAERARVLCSGYTPQPTEDFLYDGLLYNANEEHYNIRLADLATHEDERVWVWQPPSADPDPGPVEVWKWAHYEETCAFWIYQADRRDLREWGYVMWDWSRLDENDVFQEPWEAPGTN